MLLVPTNRKSCDLVQQGILGPAPDQILDAIRAEYWLPTSASKPAPRDPNKDAAPPAQPDAKISTQVKP